MNNFKKLGLTALAGSLVVSSAVAGEMSVAGGASIGLKNTSKTASGKSWTMGNQLTFTGSGELDNGMTVSTGYTMTNAAFSSTYVSLDMGDNGTLHFMNGASKAGLNKYKDVMPTAGEEVYDDVDAQLHPIAERSLQAHLIKLDIEGLVQTRNGLWHLK